MRFYTLFVLVCFYTALLVAQDPPAVYTLDEVDEPPHFPYDPVTCKEAASTCADSALSEYLDQNLKYPAAAYYNKLKCTATFEVTVEKSGRLSKIHLLEDPDKGIAWEARRLIYSMNLLPKLWTPGKKGGKPVRTIIEIPINFSPVGISAEDVYPTPPPPPPPPPLRSRSEDVYRVSEMMPTFPYKPEDCPDDDRMFCGPEALRMYLQENVFYPAEALKSSVEGRAVISFIVELDGQLTKISIKNNPGSGTGEKALRVVKKMTEMSLRWLPGSQGGSTVRVMYNLPVIFKIGVTQEGSPP